MFLFHTSLTLAYIALALGTGLILWSLRNKGEGKTFAKVMGCVVFIFSLLSILCTSYYGIKTWFQERYDMPMAMGGMMQKMMPQMMEQMMPLMMQKMKEQMGNMGAMEKGTGKNMYNMEHLQNMGSQQAIEQMQQKEPNKEQNTPQQ